MIDKILNKTGALILLGIFAIGFIGCTDSGTNPKDSGTVQEPAEVTLTERVPSNLQNNSTQAYSGITSMQTYMNMGHGMYSSINQQYSNSNGTYTYGDLTITYDAEPETRDGVDGTAWSITYDGSIAADDTTITFDNETIFSGWTANDGSAGEYTWDFGAYARANNTSSGESSMYVVEWSTDENGTLTATSTLQGNGNEFEYTVVLNEDGSGSYSMTYTEDGEVTQSYAVEWDADGNVISEG